MTTVLIADDEIPELQYLRKLFENSSNYRLVGQAQDGKQAIELAQQYKPDIIIMDINMPVNGLEAAKIIRSTIPDQIIIINTAYANFEYARHAMELHLDAYLLKPATSEEVFSTVESCLKQKKHISLPMDAPSVKVQLQYPHELLENILQNILFRDSSMFTSTSDAYLKFMDEQNRWNKDYNLYTINTAYSIARQMSKLKLSSATMELLDFDGYIIKLGRTTGLELRALMDDFFCRIALALQAVEPESTGSIKMVCDYIDNHFSDEITLQHLAELSHFSEGYLSRLFHQQTGETIRSYMSSVRIDNALRMLKFSDKNVSDIAMSCGFHNISHFHRIFKKHTGHTPREIRSGKDKE